EGITEAGLRDGDLRCRIGHLGSEMLAENGQRRLSDDALARPLDGAKHPSVSKRERLLFGEGVDLLLYPVEHHLDLGDPVVRFGGVLGSDELGELPLELLRRRGGLTDEGNLRRASIESWAVAAMPAGGD